MGETALLEMPTGTETNIGTIGTIDNITIDNIIGHTKDEKGENIINKLVDSYTPYTFLLNAIKENKLGNKEKSELYMNLALNYVRNFIEVTNHIRLDNKHDEIYTTASAMILDTTLRIIYGLLPKKHVEKKYIC